MTRRAGILPSLKNNTGAVAASWKSDRPAKISNFGRKINSFETFWFRRAIEIIKSNSVDKMMLRFSVNDQNDNENEGIYQYKDF